MNKHHLTYVKSCGCVKNVTYYTFHNNPFPFFYSNIDNPRELTDPIESEKIANISTFECPEHKVNMLDQKIAELQDLINNNAYQGNKEQLIILIDQLSNFRKEYIESLGISIPRKKESNSMSKLFEKVLYFRGLFLF